MKALKIRLCRHNSGAPAVSRQLSTEFPDLDVKLKDCAKQCKTCRSTPFVMVNKQKIAAESSELLLTAVRRTIYDLIA